VPQPGRIVSGHILFENEDLLQVSEDRRRHLRGGRIAYIPQDPRTALNPVLTIGAQITETICAHQDIGHKAARKHAIDLLVRVRISEPGERINAYPHELSGGMRQRVVIAMALANDPALIIADEATTALDMTIQAEILKLLDALCDEHPAALIFISHDLGVITQLCDRALVLYAGRVVEEGNVETLLSQPAHPYTRALLACAPELGRPDKPRAPIRGQPPPLNDLPFGCHFAPRCHYTQDKCRNNQIELRPFGQEHSVRSLRSSNDGGANRGAQFKQDISAQGGLVAGHATVHCCP
jgi:peptide/nickel transport system permease protein